MYTEINTYCTVDSKNRDSLLHCNYDRGISELSVAGQNNQDYFRTFGSADLLQHDKTLIGYTSNIKRLWRYRPKLIS